jgi:mono/diheme cytochrome c family protein
LATVAGTGVTAQPLDAALQRGRYIFAVAGCAECHTRGEGEGGGPLGAGGRALPTPFGTFYGPNITSDPTHGIGRWTEADFMRALRNGVAPDGSNFFPAFPYPTFTRMTDADMRDLYAYVRTLPPVAQPSRPHDVSFPFNLRFLQFFWKLLFFTPGPYQPNPSQSAEWNRGAYIAEAMAHCQECHTPRNFLGALRPSMAYAGQREGPGSGPGGRAVPNITPDQTTGIGSWSESDLAELLRTGETPEFSSVRGEMAAVVRNSTSQLTAEDNRALVAYLRALGAISNNPRSRPGG